MIPSEAQILFQTTTKFPPLEAPRVAPASAGSVGIIEVQFLILMEEKFDLIDDLCKCRLSETFRRKFENNKKWNPRMCVCVSAGVCLSVSLGVSVCMCVCLSD